MNTIQEKPLFDLSDQMSAYNSPLKKTGKWYRKLASELFLNAAVVNVLVMFQNVRGRKMSITTFRKQLADVLTRQSDEEMPIQRNRKRTI